MMSSSSRRHINSAAKHGRTATKTGHGRLSKEIGAAFGISLRTVKTHRARVMQKIHVVSVAELVRLAQKAGVAPADSV
jgi:DNA-binding CsgD family transcriptional regulator